MCYRRNSTRQMCIRQMCQRRKNAVVYLLAVPLGCFLLMISVGNHRVIYQAMVGNPTEFIGLTCREYFPDCIFDIKYFSLTRVNMDSPHHYSKEGTMPNSLPLEIAPALKAVLSKVNHGELPKLKANSTCIVIGSSGVLNHYSLGWTIDQYDYIFRFNDAPVKGFEEKVGSRTSFLVTYLSVINKTISALRDRADHIIYLSTNEDELTTPLYYINQTMHQEMGLGLRRHRRFDIPALIPSMRKFFLGRSFTFISPYLPRSLRIFALRENVYPTTGLSGVVIASKMCASPPDIAGFSLGSPEFPYHYYDDTGRLTGRHDGNRERVIVNAMLECGMLGEDITSNTDHKHMIQKVTSGPPL